ncbi:MAG: hypothetical protein KGN84_22630 [Acidobacteriota bacterium]|nr:hypothetical protein [Acidobacteriota bacterium]
MKKFTAVATLLFGVATLGLAADVKGFVEDANCASKPGMKDNAACAQKCIKGGSAAVLVGEDGTVYKIANQDKIVAHAGHHVTVTGDVKDGTITVASVAMNQ